MKIRAAVLYEQGKPRPYSRSRPLQIEELELAPPGADEALVEIRAAGLCHSDLSAIEGIRKRALPMVVGHECAGVVREVGEHVSEARVGDHVVMSFVAPCGGCGACSGGRPNLCETHWQARSTGALLSGARRLSLRGDPINHGSGISAFAEYSVVSRHALVPIAHDVPFEDAALFGCAVMTGVGAVVNTARVPPGTTVAIIGLGGVGLNALLGAVICSARQIVAVDLNDERLGLARQLGATHTVNAAGDGAIDQIKELTHGGVEFAFEMAGSVRAMELAYAVTRRGGTSVSAGLPDQSHTFEVSLSQLVSDERRVQGSYMGSCSPRRDIPRFIALYRQGKLPVDRLRSGTLALDDINAGFDRLADGAAVRQILLPHR